MSFGCTSIHVSAAVCDCFVSRALRPWQCVCVSNMESLKLWIALTPKQLEELNKGNEVFPDEVVAPERIITLFSTAKNLPA